MTNRMWGRLFETLTTVAQCSQRGDPSWDNIAAHFIECILDGVPCTAPLRHGLQVQVMMEALLRSGDSGKEERIEEF